MVGQAETSPHPNKTPGTFGEDLAEQHIPAVDVPLTEKR